MKTLTKSEHTCPTCAAPDPWRDWRAKAQEEMVHRRELEGRVRHLEACLRKLAIWAGDAAVNK